MYYTVLIHFGHLRTFDYVEKHLPAGRVFYISFVFSNACPVLPQCNTYTAKTLNTHLVIITIEELFL